MFTRMVWLALIWIALILAWSASERWHPLAVARRARAIHRSGHPGEPTGGGDEARRARDEGTAW